MSGAKTAGNTVVQISSISSHDKTGAMIRIFLITGITAPLSFLYDLPGNLIKQPSEKCHSSQAVSESHFS